MASLPAVKAHSPANDTSADDDLARVSPVSKELVIGLCGYAGAGTSTAGEAIALLLESAHYEIHRVKFSTLIAELDGKNPMLIPEGIGAGRARFDRAADFQNRGDLIRKNYRNFALSAAAIKKINLSRGGAEPGSKKIAFILDSIKHPEEVNLLRQVYDNSFRLVAVHCDVDQRFSRLFGPQTSQKKFAGVSKSEILSFMSRDEKDGLIRHGQNVRDAFYLADFFLDNSEGTPNGAAMSADIERFVDLLLGKGLIRPTKGEKAIYVAHASALQSACLSRQVGAVLVSSDGRLIASGKNDPPKFEGGTYDEDSRPDNRCFAWEFTNGEIEFKGCHNDRKKRDLYAAMSEWSADHLAKPIAATLVPEKIVGNVDLGEAQRAALTDKIGGAFLELNGLFEGMPGVKDAIEYSRSIHAEMAALLSAARGGISTREASLYVTVFPCHNCARHLVAAGVRQVFYIEPYVKSLAFELHSDSLSASLKQDGSGRQTHMVVAPFTGVGPRMYEDFFVKRSELKGAGGTYDPQDDGQPHFAVRLSELGSVEERAIELVPKLGE